MLLRGTFESVHKGSDVYDPLRTHVFVYDVHKGVMEGPLDSC